MDVLVEVHIAQLPDAQEGGRSELRREGEMRSSPESTSDLSGGWSRAARCSCSASLPLPEPPKTQHPALRGHTKEVASNTLEGTRGSNSLPGSG